MTGLSALAVVHAGSAYAGPQDSDIWIGLTETDSGFLLDQDTGNVWMTGPCLKQLNPAVQAGDVWTSHTVEMVSVGRAMALLDQRFELDTSEINPQVTVTSSGRGGAQSFAASIDRECATGGKCASLIATQQACQG